MFYDVCIRSAFSTNRFAKVDMFLVYENILMCLVCKNNGKMVCKGEKNNYSSFVHLYRTQKVDVVCFTDR